MKRSNPMQDLALVAVFAALIAATTVWVPGFAVPGSSVPITLQSLVIGVSAMVLGPWRGFAAALLYVVVGLAGLPVFAGGAAGIGALSRPSAGFIIAFPLYALLVGFLSHQVLRRGLRGGRLGGATVGLVFSGLIGSALLTHPLGILGMARALHIGLGKALRLDMVYWPGDVIKTVAAALIAVAVHKAFPMLALGEPSADRPHEGRGATTSAA